MYPRQWYQVYYTRNGTDWRVVGVPGQPAHIETLDQAILECAGLKNRSLFPAQDTMIAKLTASYYSDLVDRKEYEHIQYEVLLRPQV